MKKVSVALTPELHTRLKVLAAREKTSINTLLYRAVMEMLKGGK